MLPSVAVQSVQIRVSQGAGLAIASLWVWVMRVGRMPFVVDVTSRTAEAAGAEFPMPTLPPGSTFKSFVDPAETSNRPTGGEDVPGVALLT